MLLYGYIIMVTIRKSKFSFSAKRRQVVEIGNVILLYQAADVFRYKDVEALGSVVPDEEVVPQGVDVDRIPGELDASGAFSCLECAEQFAENKRHRTAVAQQMRLQDGTDCRLYRGLDCSEAVSAAGFR